MSHLPPLIHLIENKQKQLLGLRDRVLASVDKYWRCRLTGVPTQGRCVRMALSNLSTAQCACSHTRTCMFTQGCVRDHPLLQKVESWDMKSEICVTLTVPYSTHISPSFTAILGDARVTESSRGFLCEVLVRTSVL